MFRKNRGAHDRALASGTAEARRLFGGIDLPASMAGTLAAIGCAALLGGIAAGAMAIAHNSGATTGDLSYTGVAAGLAGLVVAAFVGGWVAARMARYDGGRNATLGATFFALLVGAASGIGAWLHRSHDVAGGVQFRGWLEYPSTATVIGLASATVVVGLFAAWLGGSLGTRYHRRADAVVAATPGLVEGEAEITLERSKALARQAVQ